MPKPTSTQQSPRILAVLITALFWSGSGVASISETDSFRPADAVPGADYILAMAAEETWFLVGTGLSAVLYEFPLDAPRSYRTLSPAPYAPARYGNAVALHAGLALVGDPEARDANDVTTGAAYLFNMSGTSYTARFAPSDGQDGDEFGAAVALDANRVVVGAPQRYRPNGQGAVYVYEPDGAGGWMETRLVAPDGATGDQFGAAVAASNGRVLVGAPDADGAYPDIGAAYVFAPRNGTWVGTRLDPDQTRNEGDYGRVVVADADSYVVGDWLNGWVGHWTPQNDEWTVDPVDAPRHEGSAFGVSMAMDHGRLLVGVRYGEVFLMTRADGTWIGTKLDEVDYPNEHPLVALAGDRLLVSSAATPRPGHILREMRIDTDDDGLFDQEEILIHRTDPLVPDTDQDRLLDGAEVYLYMTDPLRIDSDGDGLDDGAEVLDHGTDPLDRDTDDDRLQDNQEIVIGTDPLQPDTDHDHLLDGHEIHWTLTDPRLPDTDGDRLADGHEILYYRTDPNLRDTDGDLFGDYTEVTCHSDPRSPLWFPLPTCALPDEPPV